ncbi:site-specific integrase [Nocardiopsis composta]|uniref:Integrase n=1 Tax=Nocardiopsis composta TaxID=157465 RepID=A0A7W8VB47_9ACTN|nr:site-specific integrase [Nocardiopsis composta]MBB5429956.1 integrase [Nocardiopsis composta]
MKTVSAKSESRLYGKLTKKLEELDAGIRAPAGYTVGACIEEFLRDQISDLSEATQDNYRRLARKHITPYLGKIVLAELRVSDVLTWLRGRKEHLSSRTLRLVLHLLERAIRYAQVQDMVTRNVAELARKERRGRLKGARPGRVSKSMSLKEAVAVIKAAEGTRWYAYLVLSVATGIRTEEIRRLGWDHIDIDGEVAVMDVWTSVREDGETKTRWSRRSLELPRIAVRALRAHRAMQARWRLAAGEAWQEHGLVFSSKVGTELDRHNVLRGLRQVMGSAGLNAQEWTARELRHTFVSLLSDHGVGIEEISLLVGHDGTDTTERVYRRQLRPVRRSAAEAMEEILKEART